MGDAALGGEAGEQGRQDGDDELHNLFPGFFFHCFGGLEDVRERKQ